jgi:hypothetical protein
MVEQVLRVINNINYIRRVTMLFYNLETLPLSHHRRRTQNLDQNQILLLNIALIPFDVATSGFG